MILAPAVHWNSEPPIHMRCRIAASFRNRPDRARRSRCCRRSPIRTRSSVPAAITAPTLLKRAAHPRKPTGLLAAGQYSCRAQSADGVLADLGRFRLRERAGRHHRQARPPHRLGAELRRIAAHPVLLAHVEQTSTVSPGPIFPVHFYCLLSRRKPSVRA